MDAFGYARSVVNFTLILDSFELKRDLTSSKRE